MRAVGGGTWEEIAGALGTTPSGAKRRYQRAQASVRRLVRGLVQTLVGDLPDGEVSRIIPVAWGR